MKLNIKETKIELNLSYRSIGIFYKYLNDPLIQFILNISIISFVA